MHIKIVRDKFYSTHITGRLYIDGNSKIGGKPIYTLELPEPKGKNRKRFKESVPRDKYDLIVDTKRDINHVFKLPDCNQFDNVYIHAGNYPKDTTGCILVGAYRDSRSVWNSEETLKRMVKYAKSHSSNKNTIEFLGQSLHNGYDDAGVEDTSSNSKPEFVLYFKDKITTVKCGGISYNYSAISNDFTPWDVLEKLKQKFRIKTINKDTVKKITIFYSPSKKLDAKEILQGFEFGDPVISIKPLGDSYGSFDTEFTIGEQAWGEGNKVYTHVFMIYPDGSIKFDNLFTKNISHIVSRLKEIRTNAWWNQVVIGRNLRVRSVLIYPPQSELGMKAVIKLGDAIKKSFSKMSFLTIPYNSRTTVIDDGKIHRSLSLCCVLNHNGDTAILGKPKDLDLDLYKPGSIFSQLHKYYDRVSLTLFYDVSKRDRALKMLGVLKKTKQKGDTVFSKSFKTPVKTEYIGGKSIYNANVSIILDELGNIKNDGVIFNNVSDYIKALNSDLKAVKSRFKLGELTFYVSYSLNQGSLAKSFVKQLNSYLKKQKISRTIKNRAFLSSVTNLYLNEDGTISIYGNTYPNMESLKPVVSKLQGKSLSFNRVVLYVHSKHKGSIPHLKSILNPVVNEYRELIFGIPAPIVTNNPPVIVKKDDNWWWLLLLLGFIYLILNRRKDKRRTRHVQSRTNKRFTSPERRSPVRRRKR